MTFRDFGIIVNKSSGQIKTKCPKCSHDRKKKSDPCLSVNIDEGIWNCHNCGWKGTLKQKNYMDEIKYIKPTVKPKLAKYSDDFIKWFNFRGISEKTVIANKISEGLEYMPQLGRETNTVQFNYYRDNELINVKYRDARKTLSL